MVYTVSQRRFKFKYLFLIFLLTGMVLGIAWYYLHPGVAPFITGQPSYDVLIENTARRHCIDPKLIKAVIWRESYFKRDAVGGAGEIGLMQIMSGATKDWARHHKRPVPDKNLRFTPAVNIEIGTWYLARALKHWHRQGYRDCTALALCEYNAGRGRVKNWLPDDKQASVIDRIGIKQTRAYVIAILKKHAELTEKR